MCYVHTTSLYKLIKLFSLPPFFMWYHIYNVDEDEVNYLVNENGAKLYNYVD